MWAANPKVFEWHVGFLPGGQSRGRVLFRREKGANRLQLGKRFPGRGHTKQPTVIRGIGPKGRYARIGSTFLSDFGLFGLLGCPYRLRSIIP